MARVVVVEDNAGLLALFTHVLARGGHVVTPCRGAAQALEQIRVLEQTQNAVPDLVITDVDMPPGMTGLDLVKELKARPATTNVPIMMITGSVSTVSADERSGLAGYIAKPVLPADLARHVHDILANGSCTGRSG